VLVKRYLAELIGTFVLVVGGVGSAVLAGGKIGNTGVALAFGLALLAMAYTVGPISGCHINPAVTLGALLTRKIDARDAGMYVLAQIVGAIIGAAVILVIANGAPEGYSAAASGLGANGYGLHSPSGYSMGACMLAEIVLTMFLVLTVLGATDAKAPAGFAGIPIGLVLTLIHLVGIPITNTSVNPARSIGPSVFVGGWAIGQLWLFIFAPLIGSVLAAVAYNVIRISVQTAPTQIAEQGERLEQVRPEKLRRWS
jgi:aquaporin Z